MRSNLIAFFIAVAFTNVSANVYAQRITLKAKDAPLETIFAQIKKQSGYFFWYEKEQLQNAKKVTLYLKNADLKGALEACFEGQPFDYTIKEKIIVVKPKAPKSPPVNFSQIQDISGKVVDEDGQPLSGASVRIKGNALSATTDSEGKFRIPNAPDNAILIISYIGFESKEVVGTSTGMTVTLLRSTSKLDEVQVMAYGTTTQRLSTSSISKISSAEIEKQPVSNPIAALIGRVPGMVITQSSGLPGSSFNVQIRGRTSLANSSDPLYLIDGVPFNASTLDVISLRQSPLNSINPLDIESIEILKDADATSIYGSRGANGVILITTKKGKEGKTQVSANVYSGIGTVTRTMDYLNTQQYLEMRREAFKNDGITPTTANAPDLLVWDNNRYTNWKELLIGGTARTTDMQVNLSGGSKGIQFLIGSNFHRETTVYPGDMVDKRVNIHFNLSHRSTNNKFNVSLSASYSNDNNNLISMDLTSVMNLVPNAPSPYDSDGRLNWQEGGVSFKNPLAYLYQPLKNKTDNLVSSASIKYRVIEGLQISTNFGFTNTFLKQSLLRPKISLDPNGTETSSASFANNNAKTWIIEPQIEYSKQINHHKINILVGSTWQQNLLDGQRINATNFSSDALIESPAAAASLNTIFSYAQYRYQAVFARLNYNYSDRYIINLTGRRDGSSRFGPGKQFSNFGAVGVAWIFTQESWIRENLQWLSFGKIRGSYGITGNDKIGDYKYLDSYYLNNYNYQGTATLLPFSLSNPEYAWEENRKLEAAVDFGFLKDRILVSGSYYRNRSGNQLVRYALPAQTGFSNIFQNFPALVQNTGFEFSLTSTNVKTKGFNWNSSVNISFARNKLLEYPGLETSTYATQYSIGYPLDIQKTLEYQGVDPQTGIYQFNSTNSTSGRSFINDLTPKFYGGIQNTLIYKGIQLDFFFQFAKQTSANFITSSAVNSPGNMVNQPLYVLSRWQNVGDQTNVQKYTTLGTSGPAGQANLLYGQYSNARFSDASFIRLRNVSLSYSLPKTLLSKAKIGDLKIFMQGQNLLTITNYFGNDPESGSVSNHNLPPLRVFTAGLQLAY